MSRLTDDELENIYYAACRLFPNSFAGLRAVAEAAVRAEREGTEPVGYCCPRALGFVGRGIYTYAEIGARNEIRTQPVFTRPQASATVPEGMVLVPMKPTESMLESARLATESEGLTTTTWLRNCVYRAMLAASQQDAKS